MLFGLARFTPKLFHDHKELRASKLRRLKKCIDSTHTARHPMCCMRFCDLLQFGYLPSHEDVRGALVDATVTGCSQSNVEIQIADVVLVCPAPLWKRDPCRVPRLPL